MICSILAFVIHGAFPDHDHLAEHDELGRQAPDAERMLVLPCDLPRAPHAVMLLLNASDPADDSDGVVLTDASGHPQWLRGDFRANHVRVAATCLRAMGLSGHRAGACCSPNHY
ncbi:hypothetical protein J7I84_01440 [Arthrobacter sp. ISL-85]|uniref:nucleotidyltransferase family protein n=1 Tax=Arthrobacter sp. ISL-85 TaxID=2819115 RepID=UPI001BE69081|nr:nucleotidyltransferase family protein [Arthrobacter sp. ISL-85]MBT2565171.1 hypothetical protein [Arthrobacter sp. ISL-85]